VGRAFLVCISETEIQQMDAASEWFKTLQNEFARPHKHTAKHTVGELRDPAPTTMQIANVLEPEHNKR
jgi:hypothetical protein